MNQISDPAREYTFGTDFNYAQWTKETVLTLANVPWNNNYRDIVKFGSQGALNSYIDSMASVNISLSGVSYIKPSTGVVRISTPFNTANEFNYIRASNPLQPVSGDKKKNYYYFILEVRYIAANNTELVVQLDIWQTFGHLVKFGNCYIEKGHIGIANSKQMDAYGRDFLTVPEGLDAGSDYRVIARKRKEIANHFSTEPGPSWDRRNILVFSNVDLLTGDWGNAANPKSPTAPGGNFQGLPSGASAYIWQNVNDFTTWLEGMKEYPWVTSGITSITIIPSIRRWDDSYRYNSSPLPTKAPQNVLFPKRHQMFPNWRNSSEIINTIPARYRHLLKFFTFPYMMIELTTWYGAPLVLRPEVWADPDAYVLERPALVPPQQRITFHPQRYGSLPGATIAPAFPAIAAADPGQTIYKGQDGDDGGEYLDIQTMISSFPTMAILNNAGTAILASNAHSMAQARESAEWSQQRTQRGISTSYDQAQQGIQAGARMADISRAADATQTGIGNRTAASKAVLGAISNIAGGVGSGMVGGPAGAAIGGVSGAASSIAGGISTAIDIGANDESLAARNLTSRQSQQVVANSDQYVANSNRSLAEFASRGDYENSIAAMDARVQDLKLTPASVQGQVGGDSMNFVMDNVEVVARWKMIDAANIRRIGEHWLRYGYSVHARGRMPDSLQVMSKFTYWRLSELYISTSPMPESFKLSIIGMFESGVTVWNSPTDLGDVAFDIGTNVPLEGISL